MENLASVARGTFFRRVAAWLILSLLLPAAGLAADAAGQRALRLNEMQRQQQQDQLQLRMQQYQRSTVNPLADPSQRHAIEQLELNQQLRQQQLHQRQQRDVLTRPDLPTDDAGTRRARAHIEQQRARQESRQQLEQFDRELQIEARRPAEPPFTLPGAPARSPDVMVPTPEEPAVR